MSRMFLVCGVAACASLAVLLVATGTARATDLLVDRGLPSVGVNDPNWGVRNNIDWADLDPKDPAGVPPQLLGDDFTLPAAEGPVTITDIRVWINGYGSMQFSDMYNSISLMVGTPTNLTTTLTNPIVSPGLYGDGQNYYLSAGTSGTHNLLWQLDFATNITVPGGTQFGFAIDPDGKLIPGGPAPGGESYYVAFPAETRTTALGPNSSADGLMADYNTDGTRADQWDSGPPFWDYSADVNVQVFGVPEPGTFTLLVTAAFGLGGAIGLRRKLAAKG